MTASAAAPLVREILRTTARLKQWALFPPADLSIGNQRKCRRILTGPGGPTTYTSQRWKVLRDPAGTGRPGEIGPKGT